MTASGGVSIVRAFAGTCIMGGIMEKEFNTRENLPPPLLAPQHGAKR